MRGAFVLCGSFGPLILRYTCGLLYYMHMEIPRYHFNQPPSGCHFTAALYTADRREGQLVGLHRHDFYEMMYVTDGEAIHEINGREEMMMAGDLFFIRPDDAHSIHKRNRRSGLA